MPYSLRPPGFSPRVEDRRRRGRAWRAGGRRRGRRAGADHGDALAGRRGAREGLLAALHQVVGGVALQHADLHRLVLGEVADAGLLAQRLGRADAGAHAAQDVRRRGWSWRRPSGLSVWISRMKSGMSMCGRAGLHAGRVVAEVAAVGLDEGLVARRAADAGRRSCRCSLPPGAARRRCRPLQPRVHARPRPRRPRRALHVVLRENGPPQRRGQFFYQTVNFAPCVTAPTADLAGPRFCSDARATMERSGARMGSVRPDDDAGGEFFDGRSARTRNSNIDGSQSCRSRP